MLNSPKSASSWGMYPTLAPGTPVPDSVWECVQVEKDQWVPNLWVLNPFFFSKCQAKRGSNLARCGKHKGGRKVGQGVLAEWVIKWVDHSDEVGNHCGFLLGKVSTVRFTGSDRGGVWRFSQD